MSTKPASGLWRKNAETPEGKYLVMRRDGTVVDWPNFVIGAKDPAAPAALRAYAAEAELNHMNAEYVSDVRQLADQFEEYRWKHGQGDPDRGRHRQDDPATIAKMRNGASRPGESQEGSFVIEIAGLFGLDESFLRALPSPTLEMWKMLVRDEAKRHQSTKEAMENFRAALNELKVGGVKAEPLDFMSAEEWRSELHLKSFGEQHFRQNPYCPHAFCNWTTVEVEAYAQAREGHP